MCVNIYDVRLEDTSPACGMNWPPDLANVTTYLGVRSFLVYQDFELPLMLLYFSAKRCQGSFACDSTSIILD
jgi:hypothetical protein